MKKMLVAAAASLATGVVLAAFELVGPKGAATVVLAKDCEPSSRLAAEELAEYVFRISGKQAKVEVEGEGGELSTPRGEDASGTVRIGTLEKFPGEVPAEARTALAATDNAEAAWTGVKDGTLWIVGKEDVSELYATYRFLEEKLGVRWFQAAVKEDPGEYVPKSETLEIAPFAECRGPYFSFRRLDNTGIIALPPPSNAVACAVRNGFQVPPSWAPVPYGNPASPYAFYIPRVARRLQELGGGHLAFEQGMEGAKHFKEHPEWFALVDGKRTDGGRHMRQYCQSDPEVRRRVTDFILRKLRENKGVGYFLFGDVDTPHGACECANCVAMDSPKDRASLSARKSRTTRFVKVVNDICGKVFEEFPDADLWMWAYSTYRELPQDGVRPDPRLKLYFCTHERCYGHGLDDPACPRNVRMFGLLNGWREMLPRAALYEYLSCTPNPYTPNEGVQAHDIRLFKELKLLGWKEEAHFSDSHMYGRNIDDQRQRYPSNWQWLYVTGHLLWNPDLDENAILEDAESKYYGVAYPAMRKYQALRRKLWNGNPAHLGYSTGDQRRPVLLNRAGAKEELLGYLDEAERLAGDDAQLKFRISRDRRWLNDYWIRPNEDLQALRGKTMRIPKARRAPVLDGDGADEAWVSAYYVTNFARSGTEKHPKPIAAALATSVGIVYDDENLYFLCTAKEPSTDRMRMRTEPGADVWADDGFEVFLFPPSVENACYHLAVNAKGNVWAATAGRRQPKAYGAEARGRIEKDRYVIELKVPLRDIAPIRPGEAWKMHFGRNRTFSDAAEPHNGSGNYAYDGVAYTDVLSYRPAEFGSPYLRNGSFEEVDAKGTPKGWTVPYGCEVVSGTGGNRLKLRKDQCVLQTMWHDALRQAPKPRKMRFSFKASAPDGSGKAGVWYRRYRDTDKRQTLEPSESGPMFDLTAAPRLCEGEHTIAADEWQSFCLSCKSGEILIDDVMVEPVKVP